MYYTYPAIVHEGENGGYWAEFVDFPAFTEGDTIDDLISNAEEAMMCHIEDEIKNGAPLPHPSDIRKIVTASNDFVTLIHVTAYSPTPDNFAVQNATVAFA